MATFFKPLICLIPFCIILLSSCDEEPNEPGDQRTTSLTGGSDFGRTWQLTSIEIELGTVNPHDCVEDNFFTYYPDGTYEVNEGSSKCDPHDPPAWIGEWRFNRNQTEITIVIGDSTRVWELDLLTNSTHEISSDFNGDWRTYRFTSVN